MDELIKSVSLYPNGTYLRLYFENNTVIIEGEIDTIYETNNGLEEDEEGYKEFFACAILVKKVVRNLISADISVGSLYEISIENKPICIELADKTILWGISQSQ